MYLNIRSWKYVLHDYLCRDRKTVFINIILLSFLFIFLDISVLLRSRRQSGSFMGYFAYNNNEHLNIDLIPVPSNKIYTRNRPIILYWDKNYRTKYDHFVPNEKTRINCPYRCIHTGDRKKYQYIADVRLFDQRDLNDAKMPPDNPRAINVYHTFEPPYLTFSIYSTIKIPNNYFNATASYRSSSQVYYPYDYFIKRDGTETKYEVWSEEQVEDTLSRKHKTALVIMTNCGAESKRHEYVKELKKYIDITIIGDCMGNAQCGRDDGTKILRYDTRCVKNHLGEHFFYLAFENSVCPEYVTEKFWRMKQLSVPVVLSRAAMPYHIPNDTYIAASDFESPRDLVDYLQHLMDNRDEYKKYFDWTKTYRKSRVKEEQVAVSCQLCKLAYQREVPQISNFETFWDGDECSYGYGNNLINNPGAVKQAERKMREIMKNTERKRSIGLIL